MVNEITSNLRVKGLWKLTWLMFLLRFVPRKMEITITIASLLLFIMPGCALQGGTIGTGSTTWADVNVTTMAGAQVCGAVAIPHPPSAVCAIADGNGRASLEMTWPYKVKSPTVVVRIRTGNAPDVMLTTVVEPGRTVELK